MNNSSKYILFALLTVSSCKNSFNNNCKGLKAAKNIDSSINQGYIVPRAIASIDGFWRFISDENVSMVFQNDSVFYPDHMKRYSYISREKYIVINYGDYYDTVEYKMKDNDTLAFITNQGVELYVRSAKEE